MKQFQISRRAPCRFIALLVLSALALNVHSSNDLVFVGKAYDLDSDVLLYTEKHRIKRDEQGRYLSSQVDYFDPEDNIMATKKLDFSASQNMPELNFVDQRSGAKTKVYNFADAGGRVLRIFDELGDENEFSDVETDDPENSIVDAGFDQYVMARWSQLLAGRTIEMDFLALTRAQYIGFELKPIESEKAEKKGLMILSLQPSNFLIRLVMDPIILSYDLETMRLLRFEGLTNIERVNKGKGLGENYIARIEYSYP